MPSPRKNLLVEFKADLAVALVTLVNSPYPQTANFVTPLEAICRKSKEFLNSAAPASIKTAPAPNRQSMTAAARKRLALGMKRRWAKARKAGS
jgi:hypothetical protein